MRTTKARILLLPVMAACLVAASCSSTQDSIHGNALNVLWYGDDDGQLASGVTRVEANASISTDLSGYTVDLSGFEASNTGDVWDATAQTAAAVATLQSSLDPRTVHVGFQVGESIDGPSGGALMSTGVLADFASAKVASNVAFTGSVTPDGSVGPVGGIPEKVRAAKQNGITRVLIPQGQETAWDPRDKKQVDVVAFGQQLGVEVIPVGTVTQAYDSLVGPPPQRDSADPGAWNPALVSTLNTASARIAQRLKKTGKKSQVGSVNVSSTDPVVVTTSYNDLARIEQEEQASRAATAAKARIASAGLAATATELKQQADQVAALAVSARDRAAEVPTKFSEQIVGLTDALSWATDAVNIASVLGEQLTSPRSPNDVAEAAAEIARARYDTTEFLDTAVQAVQAIGNQQLGSEAKAIDYLMSYAKFLQQAANANLEYFKGVKDDEYSTSDYDVALALKAKSLFDDLSKTSAPENRPHALAVVSAAISAFVATSGLIQTVEIAASATGNGPQKTIVEKQRFNSQVERAFADTEKGSGYLAAKQADSSYIRWSNQWGQVMASQSKLGDTLMQEGLTYQWFANIQSKILLSMLTNK